MSETKVRLGSDPRRLPADVALEFGRGAGEVVYDSAMGALSVRTTDGADVASDRVTIGAGQASPEIVFNEPGLDVDVRFESALNPSLLVIDASADVVGIGGAPGESLGGVKLHVRGRSRFEVDNSGFMTLYRPAATNGVGIDLNLSFDNSAGESPTYATLLGVLVNSTDGAESGRLDILTTRSGTYATRVQIGSGVVVGNPSGADKGAGTINAEAVYDDNVLLTCYPLDAAYGGGINIEEWDAIAAIAKGKASAHDGARSFDPRCLDLQWFSEFLAEERRLPAMPKKSEAASRIAVGDYVNRVVETLDVLAVHVASLHERVNHLETGGT